MTGNWRKSRRDDDFMYTIDQWGGSDKQKLSEARRGFPRMDAAGVLLAFLLGSLLFCTTRAELDLNNDLDAAPTSGHSPALVTRRLLQLREQSLAAAATPSRDGANVRSHNLDGLSADVSGSTIGTSSQRPHDTALGRSGRTLSARGGDQRPRSSPYRSFGRVKPFTGDIYPPTSLAFALESRSYQREVILITDNRPRAALQLFDNLARLGLVHVLWLTNVPSNCQAMSEIVAAREQLHQQRNRARAAQGTARSLQGIVDHGAVQHPQLQLELTDPGTGPATTAAGASAAAETAATGSAGASTSGGSASAAMALASNASAPFLGIVEAAAKANRGRTVRGAAIRLSANDRLGCAWYKQPVTTGGVLGHRRLMIKRIMVLARAVRMGYNVLSLDTDVIVYRDPYVYLKAPPYDSMHMVVGRGVRGGSIVNTGVVYVQNASRHGPVAWLLTEAVTRNIRLVAAASQQGGNATAASDVPGTGTTGTGGAAPQADPRGCWDQLLFGDVVLSMMLGKMAMFYCARPAEKSGGGGGGVGGGAGAGGPGGGVAIAGLGVLPRKGGLARKGAVEDEWTVRHRKAMGLKDQQGPVDLMAHVSTNTTADPSLAALVAADSFLIHWVNLTVPATQHPLLPDEPAYHIPPGAGGSPVAQFEALLIDDSHYIKLNRRRAAARRALLSAVGRTADGTGSTGTATDTVHGGGSSAVEDVLGGGSGNAVGVDVDDRWQGVEGARGAQRALMQQEASVAGGQLVGAGAAPTPAPLPPLKRDMERLAYAADWLIGGWSQRGVLGYWDPFLTGGVPKQVFGHLVRAPGPTSVGKDAVRMQYGEYDWELAALNEGGPFAFLGSADATEPPRVVALLPDLDTNTISPAQWINTVRGLVQVALLTNRRVVWPSVPCASKWVQPNPGSRRALPLNVNTRFLTHGSFGPDSLMCTPASVFHPKCLYERLVASRDDTAASVDDSPSYRREGPRGLLEPEFELLRRLLPAAEAEPGPHNTVHLQGNDDYDEEGGGGGMDRPVMFDEPPRTEGIAYVKAPLIVKALTEGELASRPVLYLAQRTFLTQLDKLGNPDLLAKYRTFRNECPTLR